MIVTGSTEAASVEQQERTEQIVECVRELVLSLSLAEIREQGSEILQEAFEGLKKSCTDPPSFNEQLSALSLQKPQLIDDLVDLSRMLIDTGGAEPISFSENLRVFRRARQLASN